MDLRLGDKDDCLTQNRHLINTCGILQIKDVIISVTQSLDVQQKKKKKTQQLSSQNSLCSLYSANFVMLISKLCKHFITFWVLILRTRDSKIASGGNSTGRDLLEQRTAHPR